MLDNIFSRGFGEVPKDDALKFEYTYTNIMTNVVIILGLIITFTFITTTDKSFGALLFESSMATLLSISLLLRLVWSGGNKTVYNLYGKLIPVFALFFMLAELFYRGGNDGFVGIWVLFMPIIAIFIVGRRVGLTISIIMSLWVLANGFIPGGEHHFAYSLPIMLRYFCAYIIITIITFVYESIRVNHHRQLVAILTKQRKQLDDAKRILVLDPTTEINNIKGFQYYVDKVRRLAIDNRKQIAFAIIIVDNFKNLIATYGEEAGEEVLRAVATALDIAACRPLDTVARINDGKFYALFYDTDIKLATRICRKLAMDIEINQVKLPDGAKISITVTTGISSQIAADDLSLGDLVAVADANYFAAKEKGIGQVFAG